VRALAFRADGQFLAAGDADGAVRLWATSTGSAGRTLTPALRGTPSAVAFQPGGALLAVASTDGLRLLDTATGQAIPVPEECTGSDGAPAFSPDGTLLAVTGGTSALLWAV
jgi:WD40 repeat protein